MVATAAELREPHRVARYLEESVAAAYHRFYDNCRVLPRGDEEITDLHRARLWLNDATRTVIANGLRLLGVSALRRDRIVSDERCADACHEAGALHGDIGVPRPDLAAYARRTSTPWCRSSGRAT